MTVRSARTTEVLEQVTKQLNKLVPVLKVVRQPTESLVSRGLLMVKVSADNSNRPQVVDAANLFRALARWTLPRSQSSLRPPETAPSSTRCSRSSNPLVSESYSSASADFAAKPMLQTR